MKLSARNLLDLKVIDEIISEPVGGAHRDRDLILKNVRKSIESNLNDFLNMSGDEVFNHRKNKFLAVGRNKGFVSHLEDLNTLSMKKNKINIFIENFFKSKANLVISFMAVLTLGYLIFLL
jgi:acetyl-CoA carboxylase carboxyl transferase subunit alpha